MLRFNGFDFHGRRKQFLVDDETGVLGSKKTGNLAMQHRAIAVAAACREKRNDHREHCDDVEPT